MRNDCNNRDMINIPKIITIIYKHEYKDNSFCLSKRPKIDPKKSQTFKHAHKNFFNLNNLSRIPVTPCIVAIGLLVALFPRQIIHEISTTILWVCLMGEHLIRTAEAFAQYIRTISAFFGVAFESS